jgi:hypothetical protein
MNGDKYRTGKRTPEGDPDPSVFSTDYSRIGIQVGTAVSLLCRDGEGENAEEAEVHYREFWGNGKRERLLESADLADAEGYEHLDPPLKLGLPLMPRSTGDNYLDWPKLPEVFSFLSPGVTTARDNVVVDTDLERLKKRVRDYFDPDITDEKIAEEYPRFMESTDYFDPRETRDYLTDRGLKSENFFRYCYRPMDVRWLYWEPETKLLDRKRSEFQSHVFEENRFLAIHHTPRKDWTGPQITRGLGDYVLFDPSTSYFPLYLDPEVASGDLFAQSGAENGDPIPNLSDTATDYLDKVGGDAEMLFYHTIATLHAPVYRSENEGALRQDWPRVPLPEDGDVLQRSAELGRQVAALLDVEQEVEGVTAGSLRPELRPLGKPTAVGDDRLSREDFWVTAGWGYTAHHGATMPAGGEYEQRSLTPEEKTALPEGAAERLGGSTYDIYLNDSAYWQHVPERVWDYTLGGYPVIKKWLSYRDKDVLGRRLERDEVQHVTNMTRRIAALLLLEPRLNENYERVKGSIQ